MHNSINFCIFVVNKIQSYKAEIKKEIMTNYLSVDFTSGTLYEYSGTPKDGFEEFTSSKGNVSYRRYERKGITGELLNVGIRDTKFGDEIQISQKLEDGNIVVSKFKLYDGSFNVDQMFAEPIVRHIASLKKGVTYKIQPYILSAADQEAGDIAQGREVKAKYYDRAGVSFKEEDGTKVAPTLNYTGDEDENYIPRIVWKDHPTKPGKKMPSAGSLEIKTDFLISKLKEGIANGLAYEKTGSSTPSTPAKANPAPEAKPTSGADADDEHDDLPF